MSSAEIFTQLIFYNLLVNPSPAFANSVDQDQLASEPTDLDLHCLPLSMWMYINNQDEMIWLAEN